MAEKIIAEKKNGSMKNFSEFWQNFIKNFSKTLEINQSLVAFAVSIY